MKLFEDNYNNLMLIYQQFNKCLLIQSGHLPPIDLKKESEGISEEVRIYKKKKDAREVVWLGSLDLWELWIVQGASSPFVLPAISFPPPPFLHSLSSSGFSKVPSWMSSGKSHGALSIRRSEKARDREKDWQVRSKSSAFGISVPALRWIFNIFFHLTMPSLSLRRQKYFSFFLFLLILSRTSTNVVNKDTLKKWWPDTVQSECD